MTAALRVGDPLARVGDRQRDEDALLHRVAVHEDLREQAHPGLDARRRDHLQARLDEVADELGVELGAQHRLDQLPQGVDLLGVDGAVGVRHERAEVDDRGRVVLVEIEAGSEQAGRLLDQLGRLHVASAPAIRLMTHHLSERGAAPSRTR